VVPEPLWALLARARSLQAEVVSARERSRGVRAHARAAREAANRVRAVRPGASGRPPRADDLQRVLDEVRGMLQQLDGETSPGPAPAAGAVGPGEPELLTRRQRQILGLLAEGLDTAAIAARLWLSRSTVRNHVTAILQALDAHSRLEAVAHARQRGLL
jgi:DNA-binding NarL/FixJ family response regulator